MTKKNDSTKTKFVLSIVLAVTFLVTSVIPKAQVSDEDDDSDGGDVATFSVTNQSDLAA